MFLLSVQVDLEDWDVLTDEQKEVLADAIDASAARANAAEGLEPGDDLAYEPEPRWWRKTATSQGLAAA